MRFGVWRWLAGWQAGRLAGSQAGLEECVGDLHSQPLLHKLLSLLLLLPTLYCPALMPAPPRSPLLPQSGTPT